MLSSKLLSELEERDLIERIQQLQLTPFKFQFTGKRRTVSFGRDYELGAATIVKTTDLPEFILSLRTLFGIPPADSVQAIVIEYTPERLSAGTGMA